VALFTFKKTLLVHYTSSGILIHIIAPFSFNTKPKHTGAFSLRSSIVTVPHTWE